MGLGRPALAGPRPPSVPGTVSPGCLLSSASSSRSLFRLQPLTRSSFSLCCFSRFSRSLLRCRRTSAGSVEDMSTRYTAFRSRWSSCRWDGRLEFRIQPGVHNNPLTTVIWLAASVLNCFRCNRWRFFLKGQTHILHTGHGVEQQRARNTGHTDGPDLMDGWMDIWMEKRLILVLVKLYHKTGINFFIKHNLRKDELNIN